MLLPAKCWLFEVEPRGFEPLTSAVQRRRDGLQELSVACKTPANSGISVLALFAGIQDFYSGCFMVAAHVRKS
jgi:hypothetical protein